jgi:hypothetical protein
MQPGRPGGRAAAEACRHSCCCSSSRSSGRVGQRLGVVLRALVWCWVRAATLRPVTDGGGLLWCVVCFQEVQGRHPHAQCWLRNQQEGQARAAQRLQEGERRGADSSRPHSTCPEAGCRQHQSGGCGSSRRHQSSRDSDSCKSRHVCAAGSSRYRSSMQGSRLLSGRVFWVR